MFQTEQVMKSSRPGPISWRPWCFNTNNSTGNLDIPVRHASAQLTGWLAVHLVRYIRSSDYVRTIATLCNRFIQLASQPASQLPYGGYPSLGLCLRGRGGNIAAKTGIGKT